MISEEVALEKFHKLANLLNVQVQEEGHIACFVYGWYTFDLGSNYIGCPDQNDYYAIMEFEENFRYLVVEEFEKFEADLEDVPVSEIAEQIVENYKDMKSYEEICDIIRNCIAIYKENRDFNSGEDAILDDEQVFDNVCDIFRKFCEEDRFLDYESPHDPFLDGLAWEILRHKGISEISEVVSYLNFGDYDIPPYFRYHFRKTTAKSAM